MGNVVFNDDVGKTLFFGHAEKQCFFFMPKNYRVYVALVLALLSSQLHFPAVVSELAGVLLKVRILGFLRFMHSLKVRPGARENKMKDSGGLA